MRGRMYGVDDVSEIYYVEKVSDISARSGHRLGGGLRTGSDATEPAHCATPCE